MKLYTEEQVIAMIEKSRQTGLTAEYLILTTAPIELPTDEEIHEAGKGQCTFLPSFVYGAQWMRDKIQEKKSKPMKHTEIECTGNNGNGCFMDSNRHNYCGCVGVPPKP